MTMWTSCKGLLKASGKAVVGKWRECKRHMERLLKANGGLKVAGTAENKCRNC